MDEGVAQIPAKHRHSLKVGVLVVVITAAVLGIVAGRWLGDTRSKGGTLASALDRAVAASPASGGLGPAHALGMGRSELVVWGLLQAAPKCQAAVEMSGAPIVTRGQFLQEARKLASARSEAGYENVTLRVKQSGERVYGVLYYEECR